MNRSHTSLNYVFDREMYDISEKFENSESLNWALDLHSP